MSAAPKLAPIAPKLAQKQDEWFLTTIGPKGGTRTRFVPTRAARALDAQTPVAKGGQTLWTFDGKSYREGEEGLRLRISEKLGDDWRKSYADETIAYLLDSSPKLLDEPPLDRVAVADGILDLSDPSSPKLGPHDPAFLSPVQIAPAFDPRATCPAIDRFLSETLAADLRQVVHELAGYLILPDNSLQVAFMFTGSGGNGKSTAINLFTALLGSQNVSSVPLHTLEMNTFATADLYGKLSNHAADLDQRALKTSSIFKAITGGDSIRAERKYRDAFDFRATARLVFSANDPPPTSDSTHAFFRRWCVIPFDRRFVAGRDADPKLIAKLTTPGELSGLLNHGLAALSDLRSRGHFTRTETTERADAAFRLRTDPVAAFLDEGTVRDTDGRTPRSEVYASYKGWCKDSNHGAIHAMSADQFNRRLRDDHGLSDAKLHGGIYHWLGIRLAGGIG